MKLHMIASLLFLLMRLVPAQDFNNIEYLCADWGPAMTLPSKTNEAPKFSDKEEEVYFLKQVTSFTRKKRLFKNAFNGRDYEDIGKGVYIFLCKMKSDGSGKTEIKELWRNPNYSIDTQTQSTWMDVNRTTHRIALSITYAGSDITGLWVMHLDGSHLQRIIANPMVDGYLQVIDSPSWTPAGDHIVFGESLRGGERGLIAKCDAAGANLIYLTKGPVDCQPRVAPDGKQVVYIHWINKGDVHDSWLWLMDVDGSNQKPLFNPKAKAFWSSKAHWGTYPVWSPDGKKMYHGGISGHIVDISTGNILLSRSPKYAGKHYTCGWPKWGRLGFVSHKVGTILFVDTELQEAKKLGVSKLIPMQEDNASNSRW
jgi:Tol biopolymer transport system component